MTDLSSPITGPLPAPMFDSGAQPVASPNTEPNPAPIFDTGPNPDPLRPRTGGRESEWGRPELLEQPEPAQADQSEPAQADQAEPVEPVEPVEPDHPEPADSAPQPQAFSESDSSDTDAFLRAVTGHVPVAVPPAAQPVAVPGAHQFVKRWKFVLIVAGVWLLAAAAGAGSYYWWYTSLDKTIPVLGILLFVMACAVASLLVSMVPDRPQLSALALALMSAPLAAMAAAAVLHGAYYFEWITRPVIG